MESVYRQAFVEVLEVLKHTSRSILEKIPEKFVMLLEENKDNDYIANIDFSKNNWEEDVKQETQAILSLIYRDYIVSDAKRSELIKEEYEANRKKYNPDNIFNK